MESEKLSKFHKIVDELAPEKREQLYARMKGMSKEEAMKVVDRMVTISEQRKIEITARPKVLAGGAREAAPVRTDYEVRTPRTWTEKKIPDDRKIEIVKNPGNKSNRPQVSKPVQRPVKKAEPAVARAGREQVAKKIEQRQIEAIEAELKKQKNKELAAICISISPRLSDNTLRQVLILFLNCQAFR